MELSVWAFVFIVATIFVGALMQRIAGMGLGLLGGPVLSLVAGPVAGILIINVLASVNAIMQTISVRENVDWKKFWLIGPVMALGALPGAWVVHNTPSGPLQVLVGGLVLLALLVTSVMPQRMRVDGPQYAVASGVAGGFMNTLAGIAGPAITVYAQASRWPAQTFAATLQPLFFVSGALSLLFKEISGDVSVFATTPVILWPLCLVAMIVGIFLGTRVSRRVPIVQARKLAVILATTGAAVTMFRGISATFGA
ncbi:sulfite exporter TauE/SafE family protein [Corynebacterium sp. MSK032]|uniref:sulfite exporter TauE/SafE family protein n=2 Tax=Corynebacteriaceae TaxID=1653 RepID=UPI0006667377|nr:MULTISPECIES: sulfite exporter TauE/SafE family protein [Corynebacterium]ASE56128.1 sulfite exporter TauE/SafE family protein [Corynebacterium jeikeium]AYX81945.1 sulfite exporter TauE/SafE family protein [Corynebacterium jeikeium]MBC6769028.1 sulfite exporter TauE/SafE family protein [Corynebacterium sp. LK15]MBC6806026.1 sulfite exporter TauE/SafE family protein [Corynebacterium sp. LK30]MDK7314867.1 sulfite exporter TauE/SafE family protein [Corynebacterium amycolatum]